MKKGISVLIGIMLLYALTLEANAISFTPRLSEPDRATYSIGNPFDSSYTEILKDGTSIYHAGNCTWYAFGRAIEILGTVPGLSHSNAGEWYGNTADGYARGSTPKLGAIICWSWYADGYLAGHVAVVEEINGNSIHISESNYDCLYWHQRWINQDANGNYGSNFQGFIYLGDFNVVPTAPTVSIATANTSVTVKWNDVAASSYYMYIYNTATKETPFGSNLGKALSYGVNMPAGSYIAYVTAVYPGITMTGSFPFSVNSYQAMTNKGPGGTFSVGENVVLSVDAAVYDRCYIIIYYTPTGGSQSLYFQDTFSSNQLTKAFPYAGDYTCAFCVYSSYGYTESAWVAWTVKGGTADVTFDPAGGSWRGLTAAQKTTQDSGSSMTVPMPARSFYDFVGWAQNGEGSLSPHGFQLPYGVPLYADNIFYSTVSLYNNLNNGTVTHTLLDKESSCPSTSSKMIRIDTAGLAQPGCGGFFQLTQAKSGGVFYHVFTAKIPVGDSAQIGINSIGNDGKVEWVTDNQGTGAWKTYVYRVQCGISGTFQTFGFVYLTGSQGSGAVTWYLGCSNIYDATIMRDSLFSDTLFENSVNGMSVYNNLGNGNVTVARIPKEAACPTTSSYMIKVQTSGIALPELGGFYQLTSAKPDGVFYHVIIAKIPVGFNIQRGANSCGDGASTEWLTSQAGTGNWATYIYRTVCGSTGLFETFGFVYLVDSTGQAGNNVTWYVGYANIFDATLKYTFGTSAAVLTAVWKAKSYTISYNADGCTGAPNPQTKTADLALTLSSGVPTKTGYRFEGWSESVDSLNVDYTAGGIFTKNTNMTLYAVWVKGTSVQISGVTVTDKSVHATFTNNAASATPLSIFCAVYDAGGKMIALRSDTVTSLASGVQKTDVFNFTGIEGVFRLAKQADCLFLIKR